MPKTFPGGIHVPGNKNTKNIPIRDFPAPPQVAIPLQQHIGAPAKPLVNVGDDVKLGQVIADFNGGLSCPVHASVSGTVKAIEQRQAYSGVGTTTHIVIENNFKDVSTLWMKNEGYAMFIKTMTKSICDFFTEKFSS